MMFIMLVFDPSITVFEAINASLATAGTGGFGFRNDSMFSLSSYAQVIITLFMIMFSINFNSYYLIIKGKIKDAFNSEVKLFLTIALIAILIIFVDVYANDALYAPTSEAEHIDRSVGGVLKHAAFTVATIISTCGFSTVNFDLWPALSKFVLITIMFTGACAGSTAGGFKLSRIIILFKSMLREFGNLIHPIQVKKISIDEKPLDNAAVYSVLTYLATYVFIFFGSLLVISIDQSIFNQVENTFMTNFTAVTACFNNIGPGLDFVGPTQNFADFSVFSKLILSFDMLAGRLELFPMLILFTPATWKK
jgi:trk system potassium uptake protein TrkH